MGNFLDYIDWRGDLTFAQEPLGELDVSALAILALIDLSDELKPNEDKSIRTVYEEYLAIGKKIAPLGLIISADFVKLLGKMAHSRRFSAIRAKGFVKRVNDVQAAQFSAITFETPTDRIIAFSGTDDSVAGWKENLDMAHEPAIPAQKEAVEYLKEHINKDKKNYVAGHSKGGSLAMYSYVHSDKKIQSKIKHVYSLDGPGLLYEEWDSSVFSVITEIVPQDAVIGRLFRHYGKIKVIKSSNQGINQHDPFSWQVLGKDFVHAKQTKESAQIQDTFNEVIGSLTVEERKEFVWLVTYMLDYTGAYTLTELNERKVSIIKGYLSIPAEKRKFMYGILKRFLAVKPVRDAFWYGFWENRKSIVKEEKKKNSDKIAREKREKKENKKEAKKEKAALKQQKKEEQAQSMPKEEQTDSQ